MVNNETLMSQKVTTDIQEILGLIDVIKEKEFLRIKNELAALLIEYILSNIKDNNSSRSREILDQISTLLKKYSDDMEKASALTSKLKIVENDPKEQTSDQSDYLDSLVAIIKSDAVTGKMDGI